MSDWKPQPPPDHTPIVVPDRREAPSRDKQRIAELTRQRDEAIRQRDELLAAAVRVLNWADDEVDDLDKHGPRGFDQLWHIVTSIEAEFDENTIQSLRAAGSEVRAAGGED